MNKYWKYFKYLIQHKWLVMIECFKYRLYWRAIMHDLSAFLPGEFFPLADFYSRWSEGPNSWMADKYPTGMTARQRKALAAHYRRNGHHWQSWSKWVSIDQLDCQPMPIQDVKEMLADWRATICQKQNRLVTHYPGMKDWWFKHQNQLGIHPFTRAWIEAELRPEPYWVRK